MTTTMLAICFSISLLCNFIIFDILSKRIDNLKNYSDDRFTKHADFINQIVTQMGSIVENCKFWRSK